MNIVVQLRQGYKTRFIRYFSSQTFIPEVLLMDTLKIGQLYSRQPQGAVYRKPYWKCLVLILSTFCGLFLNLNDAMQAIFWSVFNAGEQVSIIFWIHRFLTKFQIFFSLIVILIHFYHVECGDGRQPRILVHN